MLESLLDGIKDAILMNLPQDSLYYIIIAITMLITLWGSYPLLLLPCFQILETNKRLIFYISFNWLAHRDGKFFVKDAYRFWTRTIQVVLLTVLGFYIPIFSSINAINILEFKWRYLRFPSLSIGSFTGVVVSQLIPAALHMVAVGKKQGLWLWMEDIIILTLFFFVMVICTYSSVVDMIHQLKSSWIVCYKSISFCNMSDISGDAYDLMCFEMVNMIVGGD